MELSLAQERNLSLWVTVFELYLLLPGSARHLICLQWEIQVQSLGQEDALEKEIKLTPVLSPGELHDRVAPAGASPRATKSRIPIEAGEYMHSLHYTPRMLALFSTSNTFTCSPFLVSVSLHWQVILHYFKPPRSPAPWSWDSESSS